jgi:predicted nuclease with TOPRIM domain
VAEVAFVNTVKDASIAESAAGHHFVSMVGIRLPVNGAADLKYVHTGMSATCVKSAAAKEYANTGYSALPARHVVRRCVSTEDFLLIAESAAHTAELRDTSAQRRFAVTIGT